MPGIVCRNCSFGILRFNGINSFVLLALLPKVCVLTDLVRMGCEDRATAAQPTEREQMVCRTGVSPVQAAPRKNASPLLLSVGAPTGGFYLFVIFQH